MSYDKTKDLVTKCPKKTVKVTFVDNNVDIVTTAHGTKIVKREMRQ